MVKAKKQNVAKDAALSSEQAFLGRVVDIGADLWAISAVVAHGPSKSGGALSNKVACSPSRRRAPATASPPMPAPTTAISRTVPSACAMGGNHAGGGRLSHAKSAWSRSSNASSPIAPFCGKRLVAINRHKRQRFGRALRVDTR